MDFKENVNRDGEIFTADLNRALSSYSLTGLKGEILLALGSQSSSNYLSTLLMGFFKIQDLCFIGRCSMSILFLPSPRTSVYRIPKKGCWRTRDDPMNILNS